MISGHLVIDAVAQAYHFIKPRGGGAKTKLGEDVRAARARLDVRFDRVSLVVVKVAV